MPQTVPNRPTKGATEPIVARTEVPRVIRRPASASIRLRWEPTRSFSPSPPERESFAAALSAALGEAKRGPTRAAI